MEGASEIEIEIGRGMEWEADTASHPWVRDRHSLAGEVGDKAFHGWGEGQTRPEPRRGGGGRQTQPPRDGTGVQHEEGHTQKGTGTERVRDRASL